MILRLQENDGRTEMFTFGVVPDCVGSCPFNFLFARVHKFVPVRLM